MTVIVEGGTISEDERKSYEAYVKDKYKYKCNDITLVKIKISGNMANIEIETKSRYHESIYRKQPHGVDYTHTVSGLLDD